jgi:hypothetical protein
MNPVTNFVMTNILIIQGHSRVLMSLTKFAMQPTLHLHQLCIFKKYMYYILILFNIVNMFDITFVKFNQNHYAE